MTDLVEKYGLLQRKVNPFPFRIKMKPGSLRSSAKGKRKKAPYGWHAVFLTGIICGHANPGKNHAVPAE